MVRGEKFTEMFLNTLGCNNNGEPYSMNRRFLCMVNCSPLTMPGDTQQCSHSNQPTKQKKQPNQLIWKPPSCPQLATRPSSHLQASEKEHDNKISGDTFAVGKKRSRNESLSVEQEDIPFKKAHQRCPTTQLNQPSRENLRGANSCGGKDQTILKKKTTKRQKSVASSFAMYHEGVPDHAICTVIDTKGLQLVHQTFLTTRILGKTMAECKRAYEMHYRELSGNCKTYHDYHGGDWHQYHCFWHRVNHKQSHGRAPRLSFTWS